MSNETRQQKFSRLAEARTNKALSAIESLSKLSNRAHYEFNEDDIKAIFQALKHAVDAAKSSFEISLNAKEKKAFQLRGKQYD